MYKMKFILMGVLSLSTLLSSAFYIRPRKAYEVIGENVNIRESPNNGKVVRKISAPYVIFGGSDFILDEYNGDIEDLSYLGKNLNEWVAVNKEYPSDGLSDWISSKFVRELPDLPFDSSYCGSYSGDYTAADGSGWGSAYLKIDEKDKGWYLVEVNVRTPGVGYIPEYYAAKPIHRRSGNGFDGLELMYVLNSFDELDNPLSENDLRSYEKYLDSSILLIVTGPDELRSDELMMTKDKN